MMKMWLDDLRSPQDPFIQEHYGANGDEVWVKTVSEAKDLLASGEVIKMSLDHDLGEEEPDGYDLVRWIAKEAHAGNMKPPFWVVHSDNPVGAKSMIQGLRAADKYWKRSQE